MLAVDNATGKSSSKRTKLSVTGTQMFEGGLSTEAIDLFDDFSVEIPESVPILGKEKIGLSLGSISVDAETDGNEFKVALGTDVFEHKLDSNGNWQKEAWQGLKEGFKEAKNSGLENSVRYLNAYGSETNLDISKGVSGKANVSGYLEGYFDENGGMHVSEGGIIVEGEIKYTYQGMVVVYVVPLYYEIGAGGGLEFVGGVRDLVSGGGLQGAFTGSLAPSISFEAGGGVGVPKVLTAGVSGKVKAELEIALDKIYQKLDVTGSASFKLTGPFGIPTYQKDFAKGTFNIYETGNPNTLLGKVGLYSEEYDINNLYAGIDIDSPIGTAPHDDSVQKWVGDKEQVQLMADYDYTNQTVQVLEEDSYENIAPAFAQMGGKNVIAWITDNKNRPDEDKTMLVYSVFENGVWSAPQAVYDDGLADYSPVMKDGYIVWQKATDHISADMTSRELGEICELYLAKWNGSSFNEPIRVTENSLIDQTPVLAVSNGEPAVVWVQNSANDFTGLTGENRIMSYENGETTIAVTEENVVTYIDCAYIDGELDIVYETDGDKDLYTIDDREIYTVSEGQITSNELPDTHPVYADFNGETVLFYYSNGSIVYIENGTEKTVINGTASTDQFTVVSNSGSAAVLWTAVSDGSAEIHGSLYDGTMWSEDVRISDLGQRIKYPFAVMNADGSIFAAFNRTEKVSDGGDYYVDGQSDLCTINIVPSYDLEITDAYFDEAAMTAYATVKNSGELSIGGFNITLTDSDVVFVTDELKAGTSVDVEIPYSVPDDMSLRTVALGVELIEGEEYNIENNTAEFEIGHADIVVKNVAVNETGTEVTADISNEGYENAQNVRVQIREDSADGEILAEKILELSIGGTQTVVFAVDKESMLLDDERKQLYVTAEGDFSEISLGNNDGYAYMSNISSLPDYETEILNYSEINGEYMINSIARNNTDSAITCQLYSAVYAADGTLKACGIEAVSIAAEDDTGVDISVPCIIETGDTIKTFMWNEQMPLCKASELTVE